MTTWTADRIVRAVAQAVGQRLCRRAVARLQKMYTTLSGDDSELTTTWDEICVQIQSDESPFWDAYEQTMGDALTHDVSELPVHEQQAIWLQTPEGEDWDFPDEVDERGLPPVATVDIVEYIVREFVLAEAGRWSNPRIRAYLHRASLWD